MRTKLIALASTLAPISPAHAEDSYEPPLPRGAAWYESASLPEWVTFTPDGTIRLEPGKEVTPGTYE